MKFTICIILIMFSGVFMHSIGYPFNTFEYYLGDSPSIAIFLMGDFK